MSRKKPHKALKGADAASAGKEQRKKAIEPFKWKPGVSGNPNGRAKGSRSVFAETFVKDFMEDWSVHGKQAVQKVREEDTTNYVKVAATLLPKDFNISLTNEAALEKLLDQFDDGQLKELLSGLVALGASNPQKVT